MWGITRYTQMDADKPRALSLCGQSGFLVKNKDMVEQMAWRGTELVGTNVMVHKDFVDTPNAQAKTPPFIQNLIPVEDPRVDPTYTT